jgi:putative addiction module component (TIGR02574 family)
MLENRYFVETKNTMSTTQIREELHHFINKADDRLLNLIYAIVQADMEEGDYELSKAHKAILDERLAAHQSDPSSGSSWEDVKSHIKSKL